jgi:hypothetical protein
LHFSPRLGGEAGGGADADDGKALLDHYDQRGADVWRTNLKLVAATAELMGAELFVAKQPTLIVPDLPDALRERCMYGHHGFDHDAHVAAFSHLYQIIDEVVVPERVIDLTPLSGRGDLFTDHVHPSVAGVEAIAEIVADALLSRSEVLVPK